jgi:hypothetical protein
MSYSFTIAGRLFFFLFPLLISAKTQSQQLNAKHLPQGITKEQSMGGGWHNERTQRR